MKKTFFILLSGIIVTLLMSACSSTEGEKLQEIYSKSAEASENLESFAMSISSEQIIKMEGDSSEEASAFPTGMPITTTIDSKIQTEPMAFHQTINTMGQTIEQYFTQDGLYMTMPAKDGWFKAPEKLVEQLNTMSAQQQTPAQQLKTLKEYVDEFELTTEGSNYILTFSSSGESVQNLIEESMKQTMPEGILPEQLLKGMSVNKVDYRFAIDQESYYPQSVDVEMNFTIEENDQKTTIKQSMHGVYSQFNEVGKVTVPQEIQENAKEIEGMQGLF